MGGSPVLVLLFCAGCAGILYVLLLYPVFLHWAARKPRPVRKAPTILLVSVIIPVRNGAPWLAAKLESVLAQDYPSHQIEILVLSDGSTDGTDEIAEGFSSRGVRVERLSRGGKAAALTHAFTKVKGELLLLTDVRQRLAPDCLRHLADCFADPEVGVASGDLVILKGESAEETSTGLYWRYETWIRKNLSRVDSLLGATGPIYAIRRELAVAIPPLTILDDVYLPMQALLCGYRLVLETNAKAYDFPTLLSSEFRRKVRTQAGIYQLLWLCPRLFLPTNRMWFHFLSLKLGRLWLPFFLLAIAIGSLGLPPALRWSALLAQAIFYCFGVLDALLPNSNPLTRFTTPCRTFLTLVSAALVAVSVFFVDPASLWKETQVRKAAPLA